jgi:hypothetical protein
MNNRKEYHIAEYYTKKGEYGEIHKSSNFLEALGKVTEYSQENDVFGRSNHKYAYIGVKGNTDLFAICFVNKKYLEVAKKQPFRNKDSKLSWLESAEQFIKTKNPCVGIFEYTKRAKELILEFHKKNPIKIEDGGEVCLN